MIYLYFEIANSKQLSIINSELIHSVEKKVLSVVRQNDLALVLKKSGSYLFSCGEEGKRNPKDVLEAAFDLFSILENSKGDLFGFNFLLAVEPENSPAIILGIMQSVLLGILADEAMWIHKKDWDVFRKYVLGKQQHDVVQVIQKVKSGPVYHTISKITQIRKRMKKRLSGVFLSWLAREKNPVSCIHLRGPRGICKAEIVIDVVHAVLGRDRVRSLPVIDFRNNDEFGLRPFALCLPEPLEDFQSVAGTMLLPSEKKVWKEKFPLFESVFGNKPVYADYLQRDFFKCFELFLLAYARMMEQKLLPAVIVFLFPEDGNAGSIDLVIHALRDLSRLYTIRIVSVSHVDEPHEMLRGFTKKRVMINPFKKDEIYRCFTSLYEKIKIPAGVIDQVSRLSRGVYRNILFYIYYLRLQKKIDDRDGKFLWIAKNERKAQIPQSSWYAGSVVIKSLKDEARIYLFAFHWAGKVFSDSDYFRFFAEMGFSPDQKTEQEAFLQSMQLIPAFPSEAFSAAVLQVLSVSAPSKTAYMKEQIHKLLLQDLQKFVNADSLHVCEMLRGLRDYNTILQVLPVALNAGIDENKFNLVQSLLTYARTILASDKKNMTGDHEQRLAVIHAAFTIKQLVAAGALTDAAKYIKRSLPGTESLSPEIAHAHLYIALGNYYCSSRELDAAIDHSKKAMHFFQELDMQVHIAESFLELAIEFLGRGNMRETLDYFTFAEKLSHDQGVIPVYVRALLFECSAYYLLGNYTRMLGNCKIGIAVCSEKGLRDYELLFYFIEARIQFDCGLYDKALESLEQALVFTTLYQKPEARKTIYAWIARTALYMKNRDHAVALFKKLPDTPEVLFFKSEAFYFENNFHKAVSCLDRALQMKHEPELLFTRYAGWNNGFSMLEGRCLDLNINGTPLQRLIKMFRALTVFRAGSAQEGIRELHEMTIHQKFSAAEPHAYLFYFFYYTILKSVKNPREIYQESAHGLTILNKALKHLQERSTTIDEPRDRINYLQKNHWNILLMEEAKANKLL
ncbi:MAG: hypothetical protein JW904_05740 [Spirochaetales bacterium]|nr:hypothetical protein [Spirochaetales bacterium]